MKTLLVAVLLMGAGWVCAEEKIYIFQLEDDTRVESKRYFAIDGKYTVTTLDGRTVLFDKKEVRFITEKKGDVAPAAAGDAPKPAGVKVTEKEYEEQTTKYELALQTSLDRMKTAHAKRMLVRVPEYAQKTVGRGGGTSVTVDNAQEISDAKALLRKHIDEIILSNKLLMKIVKDQGTLDYAKARQEEPPPAIIEPALPEIDVTGGNAPSFIRVVDALTLASLTDMVASARSHWVLAMTKGGLFDGAYIPRTEDIQYARLYWKWKAYKADGGK